MDVQLFKDVMSHWATGISVITTQYQGELQGFTANSLASVSIDPLLISMSVVKTLYAGELIKKSGVFTINILEKNQSDLGMLFAGFFKDRPNRFEGLEYQYGQNGCPILPAIMAHLECEVYQVIDVGASNLILGNVIHANLQPHLEPLLYYHRQWGKFVPNE